MTPRSCLSWKSTGRIFKTIGLRWVSTGKIFTFSTNKVDSEPPNGSNADITNQCESEQALDVSAGTLLSTGPVPQCSMMFVHISSGLVLHQMTFDHNRSELGIQDHSNEQTSSKLVPKVVPLAVKTATSRQELELLFHHHIAMLRTTGWVKEFHQDRASSIKVPVANFTLQSSVQSLRENTDSVHSNQLISPTAPSEPLKLKACASRAAITLSATSFLMAA
ncbi:hypothetical protein Tco_1330700 [Tanacetum coccineum]